MSDKFFLDTNIFAYAFDSSAVSKTKISDRLIRRGIQTGKGVVSYQVVQEFFNVAFKKFRLPLSEIEAENYFHSALRPMLGVFFSATLLLRAFGIREKHSIPWYDALILAAAIEGECEILYSEDFQHGMQIQGVRVQNPFLSN